MIQPEVAAANGQANQATAADGAPPLQIVIVGHVDHGKSTLIGRLFHDTGTLPIEKFQAIQEACERDNRPFEWAFLMDAFEEEREQNVTIDTAQTYFRTDLRKYVIIDAPGHKEFLKNMLTGAAQADAAVLLVDAAEGVREQTQRHAYVLSLLGVRQVLVLINKLDLVDFSERRFDQVRRDIIHFLHGLRIVPSYVVPISAYDGDNIASRSPRTGWYDGPTALEALDSFVDVRSPVDAPLRFPVQDVYRWDGRRYYAGRVETGIVRVGDDVDLRPSGRRTQVKGIEVWGDAGRDEAIAGECVALTFTDELYAERGEVVCRVGEAARVTSELTASLFWLGREPLAVGDTVIFKLATTETEATVARIDERIDSSSLAVVERHARQLENTEAATITLALRRPIAVDPYDENARLGRFVLSVDGIVRGGGTVKEARVAAQAVSARQVSLDALWDLTDDGHRVDLTAERGRFEIEASEAFHASVAQGSKPLLLLRSPDQVDAVTRFAFHHGYDYRFHRNDDGRIELLLAHPQPHAAPGAGDFAI